MSQDEIPTEQMRSALLSERAHIANQLDVMGFGSAGRPDYDEGFADASQVSAEQTEKRTLAASLKDSLDEVDQALNRLETGTFGVCDDCGGRIANARLQAIPQTRCCIGCAGNS